ncbi:MAG: fructose bisphosphate aldolase [Pseudomonadales bacterium]|nr:fructose bisphosphate aldolase [Pseudomonadales bacterium]
MSIFAQQLTKIESDNGFIAALDQSGGSTPKALKLYGIEETDFNSDTEMFDIVHQMRTRIITSPNFNGERLLGAILFENTLDRDIDGINSAKFLWHKKNVVPFLKVDKGLGEIANGVQLMKPINELGDLLQKAQAQDVFGTKMRSVIKMADAKGIAQLVEQQFDIGKQIIRAGLIPIIEPEIDIHSTEKQAAEVLLKEQLLFQLNQLDNDQRVMLKLTPPEQANFYDSCIDHPNVLRVVALSGGYNRTEANRRIAENNGMVASFSRALTEGLSIKQSDDAFNQALDTSIESIYQASST